MGFNRKLFNALFETKTIEVCPADRPCFYSPTRLGAYTVKPYLMVGGENESPALTAFVRTSTDTPALCGRSLADFCVEAAEKHPSYAAMTEESAQFIAANYNLDAIDYFCGSARSSWLYSIPLSKRFSKPHILLTETDVIVNDTALGQLKNDLNGANLLFISDLIGRGGMFFKTMFPLINERGGKVAACYNMLDCLTGGSDRLLADGVPCLSLFDLNKDFFKKALDSGYIEPEQYASVCAFIDDPIKATGDFCKSNPDYMKKEQKNAF